MIAILKPLYKPVRCLIALAELKDNKGARKNRTRLGRGIGSGKGKTCGRGHKGQKSRSGVSTLGLEGGQTPIFMRIPKRGFKSLNRKDVEIFNLSNLDFFIKNGKLDKNSLITREHLKTVGLVKRNNSYIKILSKGDFEHKIEIEVNLSSKVATQAIEAKGGSVSLIDIKTKPAKDND